MLYILLWERLIMSESSEKKTISFGTNHGMTLVGVIVSAGIGAIIMAGLISMISDVFKSQRSIKARDAGRELTSALRELLSDSAICTASFGGGEPKEEGFTRTQIVDSSPQRNIKYETDTKYLNNLVTITEFKIKNYSATNGSVNPNVGTAELIIKMDKVGAAVGGSQMTVNYILQTVLDDSGKLVQCSAVGNVQSGPVGSLLTMMTATCPSGYLEANGAAVKRSEYVLLFEAIKTIYGTGDGSTTFNLPDLRGYFLRGWNHASGNDPDVDSRTNSGGGEVGDNIGTKQTDQFASHT
ncbi:MAG TPA: phage tail protein, partial [Pseudobdellovibrionaceae bacterium]